MYTTIKSNICKGKVRSEYNIIQSEKMKIFTLSTNAKAFFAVSILLDIKKVQDKK